MRGKILGSLTGQRRPMGVCVAWIGMAAALGGCSRADTPPECSFFSNVCNPIIGPGQPLATAWVTPQRISAQVGATVVFSADTVGVDTPAFQWRRSTDGGRNYIDLAGATGASFTLAGANLGDDGALFRVEVRDRSGSIVAAASASLVVSSMPAVVFQDGEFLATDWLLSAIASPAQNGPAHSEALTATGGNPGAYRGMTHEMSTGPSSLRVVHHYQGASYDPVSQGAIHVIDYTEDCIRLNAAVTNRLVDSSPLIEQAGRRYVAKTPNVCNSTRWAAMPARSGLGARDFAILDGPACPSNEACPDFAGNAQPLHFGFVRSAELAASSAAVSIAHGIDNWKVTVWRR